MLSDTLSGAQALRHGDLEGAFEKLTHVKALDDIAKAGREAVQGKPTPSGKPGMRPLNLPETVMQALGFAKRVFVPNRTSSSSRKSTRSQA